MTLFESKMLHFANDTGVSSAFIEIFNFIIISVCSYFTVLNLMCFILKLLILFEEPYVCRMYAELYVLS